MLVYIVASAWTGFAVAVADSYTTDNIFPLRSLRRAMRCDMPICMRLTTRMCLLHRLDHAQGRLRTEN